MSGSSSDQLHRSTLRLYMNLMEHFNPGLQKLVSLGNSYVQAFKALAVTGEAYFRAVAKMGEQALHTMTSRSLGDVLMQISESQRRLIAELDGVFQWFHAEVLQEMDNNVRLDGDYISGSMERYEIEVRNQAAALQLQLRRGTYRNSLESSDYMQFLRQSHHEALKEEERRYRFLAEKHCGLTQSLLYLINKTGVGLQLKAEGWKELVNETRVSRPRTPSLLDQDTASRSSVNSFLHTGVREEDKERIWTGQEEQALGRVPSRAPSPQPIRARSSSVGETLGMGVGRQMKALAPHLPSSNPTLLPFAQGDLITVLVQEPRNGWLYGRSDSNFRQGWFPAAYVTPLEDTPKIFGSSYDLRPHGSPALRSHSLNNLLDQKDQRDTADQMEGRNCNGIPPRAPPLNASAANLHLTTPTSDRRGEPSDSKKTTEQTLRPELFPRGTNPFATVKLRPTTTNDRSAPRIH
ncbi:BAR/IMD domain-containing adapter protein 2-like 2 [Scleropages formosus]|uniref:BAR/IMD domain-containing adapter protein 2-like 2 n=1 Tax=Scleropages formosus TaxID=113540 RepID=UPI0008789E17|nr:brain-specific angiogenesis inhibitor 1-associated protein 2-like protein 2 [Scleropages formosus]